MKVNKHLLADICFSKVHLTEPGELIRTRIGPEPALFNNEGRCTSPEWWVSDGPAPFDSDSLCFLASECRTLTFQWVPQGSPQLAEMKTGKGSHPG